MFAPSRDCVAPVGAAAQAARPDDFGNRRIFSNLTRDYGTLDFRVKPPRISALRRFCKTWPFRQKKWSRCVVPCRKTLGLSRNLFFEVRSGRVPSPFIFSSLDRSGSVFFASAGFRDSLDRLPTPRRLERQRLDAHARVRGFSEKTGFFPKIFQRTLFVQIQ